ncbi:MAG: DUF1826 domain-containing protein [Pseudomonadota bacterium]
MGDAMGIVREVRRDAAIGVGVADTQDGLTALLRPGCAAAIWRRQPDPAFQSWIDGLKPHALPQARMILRLEDLRRSVADLFDAQQLPESVHSAWLLDDIDRLAQRFIELVPAPFLRLRLNAVTTNSCRKFHIDRVTARLVCTYRGTGTQYGISTDGAEPQRIFTVPTGAPIVLRGTLWPDPPASGLLHRSPPIEGTGETRLILVIDPIFDPDEEF